MGRDSDKAETNELHFIFLTLGIYRRNTVIKLIYVLRIYI